MFKTLDGPILMPDQGTDKSTPLCQRIPPAALLMRPLLFPKTQRHSALTPDNGERKSDGARENHAGGVGFTLPHDVRGGAVAGLEYTMVISDLAR